jgi:NMD protein affecting ribosome stability and mRNA decay
MSRATQPPDYRQPIWPEISGSVRELKRGNAAHVEPIIAFLELDAYVFGSGYVKEKIWRYLGRVNLTEKQKLRLRKVALHTVEVRASREFCPMCRFIRTISTEKFAAQVQVLASSPGIRTQQRARLLAAYLHSLREGEAARSRQGTCAWSKSVVVVIQSEA